MFSWENLHFKTCPRHYLTDDILNWYDEYWACKEGLCALSPYGKQQAKWYQAAMYYTQTLNEMQKDMSKSTQNHEQDENEVRDAIARFQNATE